MKKKKLFIFIIVSFIFLVLISGILAYFVLKNEPKQNEGITYETNSNKPIWERTNYKKCVSENIECDISLEDSELDLKLRIEKYEKIKNVVLYINGIKFKFNNTTYGNINDYNIYEVQKITDEYYIIELNDYNIGKSVFFVINAEGKEVIDINSLSKFKNVTEVSVGNNELTFISILEHEPNQLLSLCKNYNDNDIVIITEKITFNNLEYTQPVEVSNKKLVDVIKTNYNINSCRDAKKKYPDYIVQ